MNNEDQYSTENNSETATVPFISTIALVSTIPLASIPIPYYLFFHSDSKNPSIAYCKVCEANLISTRQAAYAYNRNRRNTTNLINHLYDKYKITKENYLGFLDEHNEPQYDQTKITDMQKIPCNKTVKFIIYNLFTWNKEQLCLLLSNNIIAIHLTTDLWTAKSHYGYLANMVKCIQLLSEQYLLQVKQQPCVAHMLQLSVLQDLKQYFEKLKKTELLSGNCNDCNLLDVLTDVKTRWNSVYYAWKRVLELYTSMKHVSMILQLSLIGHYNRRIRN
ncbi:6527_t:CDS:2 [Gigaspora margarita]|uniref:6527_t:CDS:1 n=1 Tax=Gigaspora margarita TaxID=4874 RepID=A0ABN7W3D2_GIGMA|nr:6527_t:CDS:2 [Gigaspora margarita]